MPDPKMAEAYHVLGQLQTLEQQVVNDLRQNRKDLDQRYLELNKQLQEAQDAQDWVAVARIEDEVERVQEAWVVANETLSMYEEDDRFPPTTTAAPPDTSPASSPRSTSGPPPRSTAPAASGPSSPSPVESGSPGPPPTTEAPAPTRPT